MEFVRAKAAKEWHPLLGQNACSLRLYGNERRLTDRRPYQGESATGAGGPNPTTIQAYTASMLILLAITFYYRHAYI